MLGLAVDADGGLIGLTDVPEVITFTSDDPATVTAAVPVDGHEGSTLMALDGADEGTLLRARRRRRASMTIDPVTGVATAMDTASVPVRRPGPRARRRTVDGSGHRG